MFAVFIGVLAAWIGLNGATTRANVAEWSQDTVMLPQMVAAEANRLSVPVVVRPESELKFEHIVRQQYDYSCGSAALVTVLQSDLGMDVTEQKAMEGMLEHGERDRIVARRGFSLLDMKRFLRSIGVDSAGYRVSTEQLAELPRPAILTIGYGGFKHFVVLRGIRNGRAFIADPAMGHFSLSVESLAQWRDQDVVFMVTPPAGHAFSSRLAITDQQLASIDPDRIRGDFPPSFDQARTQLLRQAIDATSSGGWLRRR